MLTILQTEEFDIWLKKLRDPIAVARIVARIRSAQNGNFGDTKYIQAGLSEMRIHVGPGYRIYYMRQGDIVYVVLCGGDKNSQDTDIQRALKMMTEIGET